MTECNWCKDEICVNADCPICCDYCPVPDTEGVCKFEDRSERHFTVVEGRMKEYIEREALLHKIRWASSAEEAVMSVRRIPAADVTPVRHGRWRWVAYDANPKIGNWHCTYCNRIPKSFQKEDFCPNCGAEMDKEDV